MCANNCIERTESVERDLTCFREVRRKQFLLSENTLMPSSRQNVLILRQAKIAGQNHNPLRKLLTGNRPHISGETFPSWFFQY